MADEEFMDEEIKVWDPTHGSQNAATRRQWRINRTAAYRLAYKEREGKNHPASKQKAEKAAEAFVVEKVAVPVGMGWSDFGVLWDLHPEHPFVSVLRKRSVDEEWQILQQERAAE